MSAKFKSNSGAFFAKHNAFKELVQSRMAMDIEVAIKTTAGTPVKSGGMKSEVRHFKNNNTSYRVEAGKSYSAVQEAGVRLSGKGAPTRSFTNYTTAGTSAGWFKRAKDGVVRNKSIYIQEAKRVVGL